MSLAGVRSNRGDHYQTLVAFDWALSILVDNAFQWLEVDSTTLDVSGKPISVDDVVIGRTDGCLIACQCKKNQPDFKAWSITDLGDELAKAARFLTSTPDSQVKFYSRNDFGNLAKLREHARNLSGDSYQQSLTAEHQKTDAALAAHLKQTDLTTYEWLQRTSFEVSNEFERAEEILKERLRSLVSNADIAFDVLWVKLEKLGCRVGDSRSSALPSHRLSKTDLLDVLEKCGATLVPPMSQQQMQQALTSVSAVGRSWRRDISGTRLHVNTVDELTTAITAADRSILLTGIPGSGKTCALLELQEALEKRNDLAAVYIQTREYANCLTPEARSAHGLPVDLVGLIARRADNNPVVVIIDSLDVLSLSREHVVLDFFLALIDRLLLIPKVTIIAACRDFDRKYDRRLAERSWDKVANTQALNWHQAVAPIISAFGIDPQTLDPTTQSLLQNPRELAMFADIAQQTGGFNVASSQALSHKYLETIVQNDNLLGDQAMAALEKIAARMLKSRRMDIARVQAALSDDICRRLLSANVIYENQSGNIEFGHQTLLDVLVVSGAQRNDLTLKAFIEQLPAVPFVRPSIRAYVAYLAAGDRNIFRKQLRAVFDSDIAFHIRRLVAESLAEQKPKDDDWSLILHLYKQHRELFSPLYFQAASLEWHRFWLNFLIPHVLQQHDTTGLAMHVQRIGLWKNADPDGVLAFWTQALQQEWVEQEQIAYNLMFQLQDFDFHTQTTAAALIETLLTFPRRDHDFFLGRAIARYVDAKGADDDLLWRYIAGDIQPDDVLAFRFNQKLRCDPHEFDSQDFLGKRMQQSVRLLDLAIDAVERWSAIYAEHFLGQQECCAHSLNHTSYDRVHSQHDTYGVSAENVLFSAIEKAIRMHAKQHSAWWQSNRQRLCRIRELALRYLAILALIESPAANPAEVSFLLTDQDMLTSELSFELGNLIQAAFMYLEPEVQDAVETAILALGDGQNFDENRWILGARAKLLAAIPVCERSPAAQATLLEWETAFGPCIRQPSIRLQGGTVRAPFSYERFLECSDAGVLKLLTHYRNDTGRNWGEDFLVGGAELVEWQLREAASRSPVRFLRFLAEHWADIPELFTDDIVDGVASFLLHRYGNHRPADNQWQPIEQADPQLLATLLLDEIERHPSRWRHDRAAANALEACANVIANEQEAERLIFAAIGFFDLEESSYTDRDLIGAGINMTRGKITEAVMIVATHWAEKRRSSPELLVPALRRLAHDPHPAIRALILRRLPYLQSHSAELGWELFHLALSADDPRLWKVAEPCLYYAYHQRFAEVSAVLQWIVGHTTGEPLETWGRVSALAAFASYIDFQQLIQQLETLASIDAWKGAATVWTHKNNHAQHAEQCLAGIRAGLSQPNPVTVVMTEEMTSLFRKEPPQVCIPTDIVDRYFSAYEHDQNGKRFHLYGFDEWLNGFSQNYPDESLVAAERFAQFISSGNHPVYDRGPLSQLLTRLFREAEEREESDDGQMLCRVIALQDAFLAIGVNGLQDWLREAERP